MKIAAVVLAAGGSTRFGQPKQLVRLDGETLVSRAARAAREAGCTPVVVVVGDTPVEVPESELVVNGAWRNGISTSIRAGIQRVAEADGAILLACDQPHADARLLRELIHVRLTSGKQIVASAYAATVGIPALFARSCFPDLLKLEGDRGAKHFILSRRADVAEVPFLGGELDLDTPTDYGQLLRKGPTNRRATSGRKTSGTN